MYYKLYSFSNFHKFASEAMNHQHFSPEHDDVIFHTQFNINTYPFEPAYVRKDHLARHVLKINGDDVMISNLIKPCECRIEICLDISTTQSE